MTQPADEKAASASPKKRRKRNEGQGEMLLAIPGKKGKKPAEQPGERRSILQKTSTNSARARAP
jgi:hypothetical protein